MDIEETTIDRLEPLLEEALEEEPKYWYSLPETTVETVLIKTPHMSGSPFNKRFAKALKKGAELEIAENRDQTSIIGNITLTSSINAMKTMELIYPEGFERLVNGKYTHDDVDLWFQYAVLKEIVYI